MRKFLILLISLFIFTEIYSDITVIYPTSSTVWYHGEQDTYVLWEGAEGDLVWLALYKSSVFLTNYVQWTENDGHADRTEEIFSSWGTGSDFQILIMDENANWGFSDEFTITSLDSEDNIVLVMFNKLIGNYPNPFNPETTIEYSLKENSNVQIEIFNTKGQKVKTLFNEFREAGYHSVIWNGTDNQNKPVSSGLYFYRLKSNSFSQIRKMLLLK